MKFAIRGARLRHLAHRLAVPLVFLALLFFYHKIFSPFFPNARGLLGHDFSLSLSGLLDGCIWFRMNGFWKVPWFSPSFCGGVPFFADPQSGYYSLPQWLTFLIDPLQASYLTLLIFASLGFWGFFFLCRDTYVLDRRLALLAGGLFMFNTFLAERTLVGETGYHGFALIPWLAWLLLPAGGALRSGYSRLARILAAGAIGAYWVHSGFTSLVVPGAMAALLLCLPALKTFSGCGRLLLSGLGAGLFAFLLAASKIAAALYYMENFPRSRYPLPGFSGIGAVLQAAFSSVFLSSQSARQTTVAHLVNNRWTAFPHEFAYGMTWLPALLLAIGLAGGRLVRRAPPDVAPPENRGWRILKWLVALLLLLAPLAVNYYTPSWNRILKTVPLIKATAWPFRWFLVYIPIVALTAVLSLRWLEGRKKLQWPFVLTSLAALLFLTARAPRDYYLDPKIQVCDPRPVLAAYQRLKSGLWSPQIVGLEDFRQRKSLSKTDMLQCNDTFLEGISQISCYNPIFGYALEDFPRGRLHAGSALEEGPAGFNFKQPVCYVFPAANHCQKGDHFPLSDKAGLLRFLAYRPLGFERPRIQQAADLLTQGTLVLLALFGVYSLGRTMKKTSRKSGG